jgi:uncharacterized protein
VPSSHRANPIESVVTSIPPMPANGPAFRLLPRVDDTNRFFWTSGADGKLRFLRCEQCHQLFHPPSPRCPYCLSADVAPHAVSGRATVHSFTVNHQQWIPGSDPYVIGLVAISEQPDVRLMTNLVDCEPDDSLVGREVEVVFEHQDDVFLPLFRLVETSGPTGGRS